MSIRLLRTNPRYRNNPTGFYIKQSMLDFQIMDANGKPVPGKRVPFKQDAEAELARRNAGAVSMPAAPSPRQVYQAPTSRQGAPLSPPRPAPSLAAATAPPPSVRTPPATRAEGWVVVEEEEQFFSPVMPRAAAIEYAKARLEGRKPSWDPYDRGLDILQDIEWGDVQERHAFDIAQERAEAEWEREAERMRAEAGIEVITSAEAVKRKLEMFRPPMRGYYTSPKLKDAAVVADVAYALSRALRRNMGRFTTSGDKVTIKGSNSGDVIYCSYEVMIPRDASNKAEWVTSSLEPWRDAVEKAVAPYRGSIESVRVGASEPEYAGPYSDRSWIGTQIVMKD